MESYVYIVTLAIGLGGALWFFMNKQGSSHKTTPSSAFLATKTTIKAPMKSAVKKEKKESSGRPLKIFFGSQTGTAEDFSHKLASLGRRYGFDPEVLDCEDYEWEDLKDETLAIFVLATYGEGEPTDNAKTFDEWMNEDHSDFLPKLEYTVFGLGNKTYEKYNAMGRKVDSKLEEFGAKRVYKKGEGDDDSSLEDDFAAWKKDLFPTLCEHFAMPIPADVSGDLERRFNVKWFGPETNEAKAAARLKNTHMAKKSTGPRVDGSYDIKNPYVGKIVVNKELHNEGSDRSCRHLEIEVGTAVKYEAGDHIGVYPENLPSVVEEMAKKLGVELDAVFAMYPVDKPTSKPFLGPCTVRQVLSQWADLTNSPRKNLIKVLAHYCSDESQKQRLLELSDDTKHQPYTSYIKDEQRTVSCLLDEFPAIKLPFDHFIEAVPRLAPRYYSISSSLKEHPGRVHVTSVVVEFETTAKRQHKGVCSNWLAAQVPRGEHISVPVFIEKANFKLPKDPKVPIIMVGPGTGLAPFRGFIQERKHQANKGPIGETMLFFGCRSSRHDYIYQEELKEAQEKGWVSHLSVAFSREGKEKEYVQHKMEAMGEQIYELLQKGAYFYICGDARAMAKDVRQTLKNILQKYGNKTEDEAESWLVNLQKEGKYLSDTWF